MPFIIPEFNLTVDIWRFNLTPSTDPPSVTTTGNLAWGRRGAVPASGGTAAIGVVFTAPTLLLPALTDIRSKEKGATDGDKVEVPAGSGRLYRCIYVDDIGKGFPNEHRGAYLVPLAPWPFPIP